MDGKEACDHFKYVLKFYKDDAVLCEEFVKFCERESNACDEAEMGPEKFKESQQKLLLQDASRDKSVASSTSLFPLSTHHSPLTSLPKTIAHFMLGCARALSRDRCVHDRVCGNNRLTPRGSRVQHPMSHPR